MPIFNLERKEMQKTPKNQPTESTSLPKFIECHVRYTMVHLRPLTNLIKDEKASLLIPQKRFCY